jgi:hypothetical protein
MAHRLADLRKELNGLNVDGANILELIFAGRGGDAHGSGGLVTPRAS